MKTNLSLLRYPGGKSRAVHLLAQYIPPTITEMVSPFLGGASFELAVADHLQIPVYGYDVFTPLTDFWQIATNPRYLPALVEQVKALHPLSKEQFYELQETYDSLPTKVARAAAFYVLNRASFSGSTASGGMSPGHTRFTPSQIAKLQAFKAPHLHVKKQSFEQTLKQHPTELMYLDPPYYIKSCLYGDKGDTHRNFDHAGLAKLLLQRKGPWLLSYNDCPEIRQLYEGRPFTTPVWVYGMSANKASKEILIMSEDIYAYYQENVLCQMA